MALDPGKLTGVALYDEHEDYWHREQLGPQDHYDELYALLCEARPNVVIYEQFLYQHRLNVDLVPCEYVGVIKLWHKLENVERKGKLYMQTAAYGKAFWKNSKITELGLWLPGQQHAMDATRHLLAWYSKHVGDKFVSQLTPAAVGDE